MPAAAAVRCDADSLDQMALNLLDNAVKYTPEGGRITVRTRATDFAVLEVEDDGRGIPVGMHKKYKQDALDLVFTDLCDTPPELRHGTLREIRGLLENRDGIILVTGPTGSGRRRMSSRKTRWMPRW